MYIENVTRFITVSLGREKMGVGGGGVCRDYFFHPIREKRGNRRKKENLQHHTTKKRSRTEIPQRRRGRGVREPSVISFDQSIGGKDWNSTEISKGYKALGSGGESQGRPEKKRLTCVKNRGARLALAEGRKGRTLLRQRVRQWGGRKYSEVQVRGVFTHLSMIIHRTDGPNLRGRIREKCGIQLRAKKKRACIRITLEREGNLGVWPRRGSSCRDGIIPGGRAEGNF